MAHALSFWLWIAIFVVWQPQETSAVYQQTLTTPFSDSMALLQVAVVSHLLKTLHIFPTDNMQASCGTGPQGCTGQP